jgi:hypothetical protein
MAFGNGTRECSDDCNSLVSTSEVKCSNPRPVGSKPATHEESITCAIAKLCYSLCSVNGLRLRPRNAEQRFYPGVGHTFGHT